ncbi:MAG: hypothetical protein HUU55_22655 [Myxococcales bacterium]|nr:hypothetical protein [Myxococcales bacterium]
MSGSFFGYLEARYHAVFGVDGKLAKLPLDFDNLGFHPGETHGLILRARPTAKLLIGENVEMSATAETISYHGVFDRNQDEIDDVVSIERLYAAISRGPVDLTLGKQTMPWGSGLLLKPTALAQSVPATDLRAEREGLWAARLYVATTDEAGFTFVAATPEDTCCSPTVLGRFTIDFAKTGLSAQVAWLDATDDVQVGLDFKTELELGFWVEAAYSVHMAEQADVGTLEAEAGVDYTFPVLLGWYVALEYLHHGSGIADKDDYITRGLQGQKRSLFLGTNYGVLLSRLMIDADWQFLLVSMLNIGDLSGMAAPQVQWLVTDQIDLSVGGNLTFGSSGGEYTLEVPTLPFVPPDLVGKRIVPAQTVYAWLRYYF